MASITPSDPLTTQSYSLTESIPVGQPFIRLANGAITPYSMVPTSNMGFLTSGIGNPTLNIPSPSVQKKGWTFLNILLCILIICSCSTIITNLVNGQAGGAIISVCSLCIILSIYYGYNKIDSPTTP
jgi:hypothetical protein